MARFSMEISRRHAAVSRTVQEGKVVPFGAGDLHICWNLQQGMLPMLSREHIAKVHIFTHHPFQIILYLAVSSRLRMGQETRIKYFKSQQLQNKQNRPLGGQQFAVWQEEMSKGKIKFENQSLSGWRENLIFFFFFRSFSTIRLCCLRI